MNLRALADRRGRPGPAPARSLDWQRCLGIEAIADDLVRVEGVLDDAAQTGNRFLTRATSHLVSRRGKRLRPLLTLAAARTASDPDALGEPASEPVVTGAALVELLHIGSLYHDDVMDGAKTRRGAITVNASWGNTVAILAGDFLMAAATKVALGLSRDREIEHLLADSLFDLCRGQAAETERTFDTNRDEAAYEEAIAGKTARLFTTACRLGAIEGGLGPTAVEALTGFGHNLGMAFQVVDDILDLTSQDADGKPRCQDLVQGVYTLPVIVALRESKELRKLLGKPLSRAQAQRARGIVLAGDGIPVARAAAERYVRQASATLRACSEAPGGPVVSGLERLSWLLLHRTA